MSRYTLQPGVIVPQTPFYYCDVDLLQRTLKTAMTEAAKYGYQIHYAMKANAEPHILHEIRQAGLGADCVSGYEVECAIENWIPSHKDRLRRSREKRPRDRIRHPSGYFRFQL